MVWELKIGFKSLKWELTQIVLSSLTNIVLDHFFSACKTWSAAPGVKSLIRDFTTRTP